MTNYNLIGRTDVSNQLWNPQLSIADTNLVYMAGLA